MSLATLDRRASGPRTILHTDRASRERAAQRSARLMRSAAAVLDTGASGEPPTVAFQRRFGEHPDREATRDTFAELTTAKGTQSPAMTTVPEWAGELVGETLAAFVDLLAEQGSVVAGLPLVRYPFDGAGSIRVPMRTGAKSLAAAFRVEGEPIRVGALRITSQILKAKSLAVISTSSGEMISGATDAVMEQTIRAGIATDSARALDVLFFDDAAADDARPAGLASTATGGNTAASSGTDAASISADLRARLDQLLANGYGGPSTRWVMSAGSAATLAAMFIEVQTRGTYLNIPIISGPTIAAGTVFLVDFAAVAFASDTPRFAAAGEAVLHEEDDPAALKPLDTATPARSLWQTYVVGFRSVLPCDWFATEGSVQTLTDVTW